MVQILPQEAKAIQLALEQMIEDVSGVSQNQSYPFNPEGRMLMSDILKNAKSALVKIKAVTGIKSEMEPYREGDEDEFLTKQS